MPARIQTTLFPEDSSPVVVEVDEKAVELLAAFADRDGDDAQREEEKATALRGLAYVLGKNFKAAEKSIKDGAFSVTFKVTWDRNESPTEVKAVARCSTISTADISLSCIPPQDEDQT